MQQVATVAFDELLDRARAGDSPALGELLEMYRQYVRLLARVHLRRLSVGKDDASDLTQEVFLQAHQRFGQFRGASEPELVAWLRRILATRMANNARRFLGTQRRDPRRERALIQQLDQSSLALGSFLAAKDSTPSTKAEKREQAVMLANALAQLSDDYRDVIVLRHLEERSFPEVAESMGRTLDSVKNLWARALMQLRRRMGAGG